MIFCSNCVKLVTFSILPIYAQANGDALKAERLSLSKLIKGKEIDLSFLEMAEEPFYTWITKISASPF